MARHLRLQDAFDLSINDTLEVRDRVDADRVPGLSSSETTGGPADPVSGHA
jgi:hypothetical protein